MTRLPLTVIGGYLGAGKTTLINALLTSAHGRRLMVMVNDFGAVNIDAALLASASADTLELTNGCVCCTMGADLFMAVGDVLDRPKRPDHLIIEASGIADPARIAAVAQTEPDLSYAGIVTVVDALNFANLADDLQIGRQITGQVAVADLILVTKGPAGALSDRLAGLSNAPVVTTPDALQPLIWEISGSAPDASTGHAHFVKWSWEGDRAMDRDSLTAKLTARPAGLYRIKGFVAPHWQVQVVGRHVELRAGDAVGKTRLVGIGPEGRVTLTEIDAWWQASP